MNPETISSETIAPTWSLQADITPTDDRVYTMYHGTNVASAKAICSEGFRQSAGGMLGRGVYVSRNIDKARRYPLDTEDHLKVILKLEVDVGKVKKIDSQNHPLRLTWHDEGYDTAWVPAGCGMVTSQLEEDCVWDPERVKVIGIEEAPVGQIATLRSKIGKPSKTVQIFVVNFQGSTRTYDMSLSDRVQQLKVKIHREEGVPPREQILTFESQQLEGERTLRSYNIRAQSTIQLQARLRGGQS
ncbi:uncharacterized protein LOC116943556 [Petromyzon marinus]|uniref:uncharacterized protein LOC116943556 n=1 Tax=Petromyzon marinus TaxID=7757 RepID=UPI003F6FEB6D